MELLIEQYGAFGRFQKFSLFLIGFLAALSSMTIFGTIFIAAKPKFLCRFAENTTNTFDIPDSYDTCIIWKNLTKIDKNGVYEYKSIEFECFFDEKYYGRTIITDWDLICDNKVFAGLTQTIYMIGSFCSIFSGYFGDRYGRKKSTMMFLYLLSVTILLSEILQLRVININVTGRYVIYCISQFLIGAFINCVYISSYVLLLELTTHRYHTIFSNIKLYIYVFGELLAMAISYWAKDWHIINWTLAGFSIIVSLLLGIFLPESPRWLISQKKYIAAYNSIKHIAKMNRKQFDVPEIGSNVQSENEFYAAFSVVNHINSSKLESLDSTKVETKKNNIKAMFKGIFTPKSNCFKTILVAYLWITVSLLYYGVSFSITSVDQINPYIIYIFQSLAEVLGYTLCLINDKFGRRKTNMFYFVLGGLACLAVSLVPRNKDLNDDTKVILDAVLIISLTSIGKLMVSAAFNTCFVYSTELYPTYVRNFVVLFFSCMGRIGSIISPQINLLGDIVWKPLPYMIYSVCALLAGFFVFLLPETIQKGQHH